MKRFPPPFHRSRFHHSRLHSARARHVALLGGITAVFAIALAVALTVRGVAHADVVSGGASDCAQPAVLAAEAQVPRPDSLTVVIPAGEPAVVASVNGAQITAEQFETRVLIATQGQGDLDTSQLPPGLPAEARAELLPTPDQLRARVLNRLIANQLLLQEAARLGLTATQDTAVAAMQATLQTVAQADPSDPARITFTAFLCANGLTEATYLTDARTIQAYRNAATIRTMQDRAIAPLPPQSSQDPSARAAAIDQYVQQLRAAATVQVFI
jgi:SurA-like N-terminal domain